MVGAWQNVTPAAICLQCVPSCVRDCHREVLIREKEVTFADWLCTIAVIHWLVQHQSLGTIWWARCANCGSGAKHPAGSRDKAPGVGSRGKSTWSWKPFDTLLHYHNLRSQPICSKISLFFAKQKKLSDVWGKTPMPHLDPPVSLYSDLVILSSRYRTRLTSMGRRHKQNYEKSMKRKNLKTIENVAINDVLPLKAARCNAVAQLKCFGARGTSNLISIISFTLTMRRHLIPLPSSPFTSILYLHPLYICSGFRRFRDLVANIFLTKDDTDNCQGRWKVRRVSYII